MSKRKKVEDVALLGIAWDHEDGHKRITRGERLLLLGGSEQTHKRMQRHALKLQDFFRQQSKSLGQLGDDDLREIADELSD